MTVRLLLLAECTRCHIMPWILKHIVRKWKWIAKNRARFDTSKNFIGRVLLLSKTDKWEYLQSLITEKKISFLFLTFGKFLEGMRTCSIFWNSFSLLNNVRCYCAPYLEISSSLATSLEDNSTLFLELRVLKYTSHPQNWVFISWIIAL